MSSNSSCDKEIKTRMGKANAVFRRLEKIWKSNGCSLHTTVRLYESIVLSTLLYGAETWPITVANGRRLGAAHHRWLRRILNVTWRDKIPNKTIRERTRQVELGYIIRRKRLTWLGHVARMNKNRRAKQVMNWTPGRKTGKKKTEEILAGDHLRRPARTGTDVGRCSQCSGGQRWLEETHCPMCCPAWKGLRSYPRRVLIEIDRVLCWDPLHLDSLCSGATGKGSPRPRRKEGF